MPHDHDHDEHSHSSNAPKLATAAPKTHGHAENDHSGHDHSGHNASKHNHSDHGHAGHSHADHGHAGHNHLHGIMDERRIGWAFVIIALFMGIEVVGGFWSGSLALLADAGHMVSDAAALGFSWLAIRIGRRAPTNKLSYGFKRFEILAAFVNGLALFVIAAWIIIEALRRFNSSAEVLGGPMLTIAILGLVANVGAFMVLHGGNRENLNMRSAWLHVVGDMLGSAVAIVAAGIIMATGWMPIDPLLSIFVAVIVLKSAWQIVKSSAHILLEGAPAGLDLEEIKADLQTEIDTVRDAHHLHAWSITAEEHLLTLHVVPEPGAVPHEVIAAVKRRLAERFAITHVTIQLEEHECLDGEHGPNSCH